MTGSTAEITQNTQKTAAAVLPDKESAPFPAWGRGLRRGSEGSARVWGRREFVCQITMAR